MEKWKNKTINEVIDLLGSLETSNFQSDNAIKVRVTDEIKVESIIDYLEKSKEIVSKFKEFDIDNNGNSKIFRRLWRRLLGEVIRGVGKFLVWVGEKLIAENP